MGVFGTQQAHQGNHTVGQNWDLVRGEDMAPVPGLPWKGGSCQPDDWLGQEGASVPHGTEAGQADAGQAPPLQVAGGDKGVGPPDPAQVDHCTVIGHLH